MAEERPPDVARLGLLPDLGRYLEHYCLTSSFSLRSGPCACLKSPFPCPFWTGLYPGARWGSYCGSGRTAFFAATVRSRWISSSMDSLGRTLPTAGITVPYRFIVIASVGQRITQSAQR